MRSQKLFEFGILEQKHNNAQIKINNSFNSQNLRLFSGCCRNVLTAVRYLA